MPIKKLKKSDDNVHMVMMLRVHCIQQRELAERKKAHEPAAAFFTMVADLASKYCNALVSGEILTVTSEAFAQMEFLETFGFDPERVEGPFDDDGVARYTFDD